MLLVSALHPFGGRNPDMREGGVGANPIRLNAQRERVLRQSTLVLHPRGIGSVHAPQMSLCLVRISALNRRRVLTQREIGADVDVKLQVLSFVERNIRISSRWAKQ